VELTPLRYFRAIARAGHMTRAAREVGVSQPALSAQLAELESALGVRLFERDRRRVLVTPAGVELVERARAALRAAGDVVEAARRLVDPLAGTLRIGVIPTVAAYALPHLTPALRRRHGRLRVEWVEDKTRGLVVDLGAGTLDAALLALEADIGDLEHEVIAEDRFVVVARRDHRLGRARAPLAPADLEGDEVFLLEDGHCFRSQALALCHRADAREAAFRATSLTTLVQMVRGAGGTTLLPTVAVKLETRRGGLVVRRFRNPPPR